MVTHTHIHTHTYTHDNYYNPRCAHAQRGLIKVQFLCLEKTKLKVSGIGVITCSQLLATILECTSYVAAFSSSPKPGVWQ